MQPSEQIVLVMVSSAHRDAAFAAAEFMDYLKTKAVLWKRELSETGERWLESTDQDAERSKNWQQN